MKIVKSVLLGSAAGIFAVAGAQVADVPVKAVEYVTVCSLYGAGFWYVPRTDTCIKLGAYARAQAGWDIDGGQVTIGAPNRLGGSPGGRFDRIDTNDFNFRARGVLSTDMRTQTEYGTLRSYMNVGTQWSTSASGGGTNPATPDTLFVDRAFIQFAGFTAGRIRSFFDIVSSGPYAFVDPRTINESDKIGIYGIAYTAQFGGGLSAIVSLEDGGWATGGRGRSTVNLSATTGAAAALAGPFTISGEVNDNKGQEFFDPVFALRIDQAWGFGQVSGALHDASGGNYASAGGSLAGSNAFGHPADKWGFAASAGFTLNNAFGVQGDSLGAEAVYSQGATGYATKGAGPWSIYGAGNNVGLGWLVDGVFAGTAAGGRTNVELTQAWSIFGVYQHLWTPKWKTSVYGGFVGVNYDGAAKNMICNGPGGPASPLGFTAPSGAFTGGVSNCDPNFGFSELGSRILWNPVPDVDIGVDVLWTHLDTAFAGTATLPASGGRPAGVYNLNNQDVLSAIFRFQRNHDTPRLTATDDDKHTLTIEHVADLYSAAGHSRTIRTLQRYCVTGHLDCLKAPTKLGDMYLITPESVARHVAELTEISATTSAATDRGEPRPAATSDAPEFKPDDTSESTTTIADTSRLTATDRDHDTRYVARLEGEVEFLRGQVGTKDAQIKELTERSRQTNVLIGGLQRMLAPLLTAPEKRDQLKDVSSEN